MIPYSMEELTLFADGIDKLMPRGTHYFLVISDGVKCGAIGTFPAEAAEQIKAAMAELSKREVNYNN